MKQLKNGRGLTDSQMGFLLIVPGLAVFLAIILYPFVDAVITSFTDRSLIYPDYKFVAFANYAKVFKDPYFGKTLITTLLFVLGSTVLPYTLGMIWAIDLNQGFKGAEFLRGVTLVNWIIPGTAIGFLWSWIFNGQYGILNSILKALGILETGIPWLGQTNTALLCVIIARTWQMLPWYMAFLLGGLQSVSLDQFEAAHIDGTGHWRIMTKIVFPMVVPGMTSIAIYGFVWSWNDLLYSMTLVTDTAKRTLASGLVMTFLGEASTNWGYMMAASTEYTIVADVALVKGLNGSGYSAGVTFQQTDGTQFYHFRLDHGVKASSQLLRWPDQNSAAAPPAKHETEVKDGQAYRLRVTVSGEKIIGYVDSVKQFEYDAQRGGAV